MSEEANIFEHIKNVNGNRRESWDAPDAEQRTDAMPASDRKVEEMRQRLERGEGLWNSDDRRSYDE